MRSAIDVQDLARHLTGLREIEDGVGDVLDVDQAPKRRQRRQEISGIVLVHRSVDDSRSNRVDPNTVLRVFHRETSRDRLDRPS